MSAEISHKLTRPLQARAVAACTLGGCTTAFGKCGHDGYHCRCRQYTACTLWQADAVDVDAAAAQGGVFEAEAALFGAFKQEWSLKLAKALGAAFGRASDRYRRTLEPFASHEELAR